MKAEKTARKVAAFTRPRGRGNLRDFGEPLRQIFDLKVYEVIDILKSLAHN